MVGRRVGAMAPDEQAVSKSPRVRYAEFLARFRSFTDQQLIDAFNSQVENRSWVSARADYLTALHEEFKARRFDFSSIGDEHSLCFGSRVRLIGMVVERLE
jgi:hypothetical protein